MRRTGYDAPVRDETFLPIGQFTPSRLTFVVRTAQEPLVLADAEPRVVVRMVIRQGMTTAAAGIGIGLLGAVLTTRLMASLLYGVRPTDAATLAAVTALLAAATFVANYVPAQRASRVDPLVALREE
jgi:hypothetical protein